MTGYGASPLAVPDAAVDSTAVCLYLELGKGLSRGIRAEKKLVIVTGSCTFFCD